MLGQVEGWADGRRVDWRHARQRYVLAVLLVEADQPVATDQVIDRIWGEHPPRRARQLVSNYLYLPADADVRDEVGTERRGEGYVVLVDPDRVDLHRFRGLVTRARAETNPAVRWNCWSRPRRCGGGGGAVGRAGKDCQQSQSV
ncbi:hypothetical protein BS329_09805 [Amycolatopsis coloradensis]|uniref:OmpR/PhoB-type domain-containing protein n=1 Tax=Amycolatopsis coloradensis TaxID=76021 RepID=A0A1R0KVW5_9PSEU|nr:hypothetical protein [Amycolatopsis coloradensis]OLZ53116.1 hypothetical protein BS329_09805 [Amycolatopsis coloradensis]